MIQCEAISEQFRHRGHVVIRQLFDLKQIIELRIITERIYRLRTKQSFPSRLRSNKKTLDLFKKLEYFSGCQEHLKYLLDTIADERILSILQCICDRQLLFNGVVYFFSPTGTSWRGDWHRDGQIIAPNDDVEKIRIFSSSFIRVHLALINDNFLEIVPGSHLRWDNPQELAIRKGFGKSMNSNDMPCSQRIWLEPGDAVFFDGYSIHRGNYFADRPRRMLAMLYGSPVDWFTPSFECRVESKVVDYLSLSQKVLFQYLLSSDKD